MPGLRTLAGGLVDPVGAAFNAVARPAPFAVAAWLVALLVPMGVATLPRQFELLHRALPLVGEPLIDAQQEALRAGLERLVVADRLVPSPSLLLAALALVVFAEPVLMLARDRRAALWAVAALGLAPLLVDRLGELALTYVAVGDGLLPPGEVLQLPHRFVTGPRLVWGGASPPGWLMVLEARVNLIALWSCALWTVGLNRLDGGRWAAWHIALPLACLLVGGLLSFLVGPLVIGAILAA
jgi:hypothetical protein